MTTNNYSIINIFIAALGFLIPLYQVLFKKNKNFLRRITPVGYFMFCYATIIGIESYFYNNAVDREKKQERKELADTLYNRFSAALSKSKLGLTYDSTNNSIVSVTNNFNSLITMTNGTFSHFSISHVSQTVNSVNESQGQKTVDTSQSNYFLEQLRAHFNTLKKSDSIYLFGLKGTQGIERIPYVTASLLRGGYRIAGTGEAELNTGNPIEGIYWTTYLNKPCLLLSNYKR